MFEVYWLGALDDAINQLMTTSPWVMPIGLCIFVVALGALLVFGKRK